MLFSSLIFLWFFFPVVFILSRFLKGNAANIMLLAASLVFYAWGEPVYILLILFSITFNWLWGFVIERCRKPLILVINLIVNLGLLGYFKYFDFFIGIVNRIMGRELLAVRDVALPLGISFFTFQILSYTIDLYRGKYKAEKNLLHLALYISFFPQLIAGPIVRYVDIKEQITNRCVNRDDTSVGIRRFIYGLSKKVLIANFMGMAADAVFNASPLELNGLQILVGGLCYTLQIYYDFSGYSDMAIGLGRMFGFRFLENFNDPYLSSSVSEFWRRWHISLGTWFREYVYIPLGGNRKGKTRTLVNLMIVMFLTGLWHGAGWNFIIWGVVYGIFMVIERLGFLKVLDRFKVLGHIYTLILVSMLWIVFRVDTDLETLRLTFGRILRITDTNTMYSMYELVNHRTAFMIPFAIFGCGIHRLVLDKMPSVKAKLSDGPLEYCWCAFLLAWSILTLAAGTYNPFIYFRF